MVLPDDTIKLVTFLLAQKFRYSRFSVKRLRHLSPHGVAHLRIYDPECHIFVREGRQFRCMVSLRHLTPHVNYGGVQSRFHFSGRRWRFMRRSVIYQFESDDVDHFIKQVTDWLKAGYESGQIGND
jgi:hypothetical protein